MLYSFSAKLPDTPKKSVANGTGVPALKSPGAAGGGIAVRPAAVLLKPEAVVAGKPTVTSVSPKPLVFKVLMSLNDDFLLKMPFVFEVASSEGGLLWNRKPLVFKALLSFIANNIVQIFLGEKYLV